jgi:hypothetical protein
MQTFLENRITAPDVEAYGTGIVVRLHACQPLLQEARNKML